MKITASDIRSYLCAYQQHVTHCAVGHTKLHTYHCTPRQLVAMEADAKQGCRKALNAFSQFLRGAKANRKQQEYSPLVITTLEGVTDTGVKAHTIHYHFALGNIPSVLTTDELRQVFRHCWVDIAGLSSKGLWLAEAYEDNAQGWINYITKEAERGNVATWDFENTRIPHIALANGQQT